MVDVAIVGYGPVGATLAILLAQRGWRVVVLERWTEPYPMPRAVHFDHEVGRILQSCGIGEALAKISEPAEVYEFQNAERRPLVRFGRIGSGLSGWPQSSMFSQPELEALLFARVGELAAIEVRRGVHVTGIEDDGAAVTVLGERVDVEPDGAGGVRLQTTGAAAPVRARYVVGCDGANSTVRNLLGLDMTDRAFFYDWLIVDVDLRRAAHLRPAQRPDLRPRPADHLRVGRARAAPLGVHGAARRIDPAAQRRGHGMAAPRTMGRHARQRHASSATPSTASRPAGCRNGAEGGCSSPATPPIRHHRSPARACAPACATPPTWRGSSTCVLGGTSPDELLDAYGTERAPNMEAVIELAIEMGKMICVCDPDEVRARDEMFLAVADDSITEIPPFPGISEGIILPGTPRAGELFVQADVERDGVRSRFDDAVGAGWRLVTDGPAAVDGTLAEWFTSIGGAVVAVGGESALTDVDGAYGRWFTEHGVIAALQRPDFVLFGTAEAPSDVDGLLRALQGRLAGR